MKIRTTKGQLFEALKSVTRIVEKNSNYILEAVKIVVREGKMVVTGTNLDIVIERTLEVECDSNGELILDAKHFVQIVGALPDGVVEISGGAKEGKIRIVAGRSKFNLQATSAGSYPEFKYPDEEGAAVVTMGGGMLAEIIRKTLYATHKETDRRNLCGVHFEFKTDGTIIAVGTNGRLFALVECKSLSPVANDVVITIPNKLVGELKNLKDEESLTIISDGRSLKVQARDTVIAGKLLDEAFPNYRQVIPDDTGIEVKIDRKDLDEALLRAEVADGGISSIPAANLSFSRGKLTVSSNTEVASASSEIEIKYEGEPLEILFSTWLLHAAISCCDDDEITVMLKGAYSMMKILADGQYLAVVMPLRNN